MALGVDDVLPATRQCLLSPIPSLARAIEMTDPSMLDFIAHNGSNGGSVWGGGVTPVGVANYGYGNPGFGIDLTPNKNGNEVSA